MKNIKNEKQSPQNTITNNSLSINIGIGASIALVFTIIKDFLILCDVEVERLNGVFALLVLILFFLVLNINIGSKIEDSATTQSVIDVFTFVAIMVYGLESTFIAFRENKQDKIIAIVVLIVFLGLCIWTFVYSLFFRRNKKCNTD